MARDNYIPRLISERAISKEEFLDGNEGLAKAVRSGMSAEDVANTIINGGASLTITGDLTVGSELSAVLPDTYGATGYQWYRDGEEISGATSSTYTTTESDAGYTVSASATGVYVIATGVVIDGTISGSVFIDSLQTLIVYEGDSITAGSNGPSHILYDGIFSNGVGMNPIGYNNAVAGQTAEQMLTQVSDINDMNPDVVVLLAGINDLTGGIRTASEILSDITSCANGYISGGATAVVILTILPRTDLPRESDRLTINDGIRDLASESIRIVDMEESFDSELMTKDGTHPNAKGAVAIGRKVGEVLGNLFSEVPMDYHLTSTNLIYANAFNPSFNSDDGLLPNGWNLISTLEGVTVNTLVEPNDTGTNDLVITLSGTPTSGDSLVIKRTVSGIETGESYTSLFNISVDAGSTGVASLYTGEDTSSSALTWIDTTIGGDAISGVIRGGLKSTNDGTSSAISCGAKFNGDISATIRISNPFLLKAD